jgi:hypothetical protein
MGWFVLLHFYAAASLRRPASRVGTGLLAHDPAQGLVEYGLILLMIVVVCIAIVTIIGVNVSEVWYKKIVTDFPG